MSKETNSVIYPLKYPIKWASGDSEGKKLITEVEFRRPKGKDLKRIGKDADLGTLLDIAAKVSEYTPRFFDELDGLDYMNISEVINDFLDGGQSTGKTS